MTLSESLLWSFSRSTLLAGVALGPLAILLRHILSRRTVRSRQLWLLLSIFPFFIPELLIGFHYRLPAARWSSSASPLEAAAATELLYAALQLTRCLAAGVAVSLLLPQSMITQESLHSWDLLRSSMRSSDWRKGWLVLRCRGPWSPLIVSWSLMALITFQEFETAALLQIDRSPVVWSVWLFDAHAARQPLSDSLKMMAGPILCELLLLAPAGLLLLSNKRWLRDIAMSPETTTVAADQVSGKATILPAVCVLPGLGLFLLWPMMTNAQATLTGLLSLSQSPSSLLQATQQILTSLGFAAAATILVMPQVHSVFSAIVPEQEHPPTRTSPGMLSSTALQSSGRFLTLLPLVPGLMGSLVCSLLLLAFFQLPGMRLFYDSWLPLLIGQTLAVLPKAALAVALLQKASDASVVHSATLLLSSNDRRIRASASGILWRLTTGRWLMACLLVTHWCFWDVTVASLLRPVELEPVVTRLYNEMHYGRTEALLSLTCLATVSPGIAWLLVTGLSRLRAARREWPTN